MNEENLPLLRKSLLNRLAFFFALVGLFSIVLTSVSLYSYYARTLEGETSEVSRHFETYLNTFTRQLSITADLLVSSQRNFCGDRRVLAWLEGEKMENLGSGNRVHWAAQGFEKEVEEAARGRAVVKLFWRDGKVPGVLAVLPLSVVTDPDPQYMITYKHLDRDWLRTASTDLGAELVLFSPSGRVAASSFPGDQETLESSVRGLGENGILTIRGQNYGHRKFTLAGLGEYAVFTPADSLRDLAILLSLLMAVGFSLALAALYVFYKRVSGKIAGEIEELSVWANSYLNTPNVVAPPTVTFQELRQLEDAFDNLVSRLDGALNEIEFKNLELSRQIAGQTEALTDRNQLLDLIITEMPQALFLVDAYGRVVHANTLAAESFGVTQGLPLPRALSDKLPGFDEEEADATFYWENRDFHVHSRLLPDSERRLFLAMDVTERRIMQEQLFQSQKLESVSRLAGGVAHDFNNALASIIPSVDMLRIKVTDEKALTYVETIEKAALRGADVVRKLLAFSRAGYYSPRQLNLNEVIDTALKVFKPTAKYATIDWQPSDGLPLIFGDEAQLQQLIFNLAINSLDATDGRCRITIRTWSDPERRKVMLTIADDGPGVSQEVADHIFDPFFTTKKQTTSKTQGTGLGLAVCYGVVDRHGGRIRLISAPGGGALFEIELPFYQEAEAPKSGEGPQGGKGVKSEDIIIGGR